MYVTNWSSVGTPSQYVFWFTGRFKSEGNPSLIFLALLTMGVVGYLNLYTSYLILSTEVLFFGLAAAPIVYEERMVPAPPLDAISGDVR